MIAANQVYQQLRDRILKGELKPGTALKERDLCTDLNVSRTPIREALRRLSAEGLAQIRPRRSIVVASFDPSEVEEVFELGVMLESFIAGLAAEKATPADVEELTATVLEMEALLAYPTQLSEKYPLLDRHFHEQLANAARSPRISTVLQQTVNFRLLTNVFQSYAPVDIATSVAQHRNILRAIEAGNPDWAASAMRTHIRTGQAVKRGPMRTHH